jgi:hypothetical protein
MLAFDIICFAELGYFRFQQVEPFITKSDKSKLMI